MADTRIRRTRLETALILVGVIAVGIFFGAASYMFFTTTYAGGERQGFEVYMPYMLAEIPVAIVAWILLPKAISHHPDEYRTRNPIAGTTGTFVAGFIVVVCSAFVLAAPASMVALVSMVSRGSTRWSAVAMAALALSFALTPLVDPEWQNNLGDVVFLIIMTALAAVAALLIGQYRSRRREATRLVRAEADAARADERTRIARDMHDTLSHRLSLIAIHAGVLEQQPDLPNRAEVAATIKEQSAKAVEDLGQVLRVLREGEPNAEADPLTSLDSVIDEARAAGQEITTTGQLGEASTAHAHLIHRGLTEGLTNARKHAPGAPVVVEFLPQGFRLTTTGAGHHTGRGSGMGLIGLRERARLLGARVAVQHAGGDHVLEVMLP